MYLFYVIVSYTMFGKRSFILRKIVPFFSLSICQHFEASFLAIDLMQKFYRYYWKRNKLYTSFKILIKLFIAG